MYNTAYSRRSRSPRYGQGDVIIVDGVDRAPPAGVSLRNWREAGVAQFQYGYRVRAGGAYHVVRNRQRQAADRYPLAVRGSDEIDEIIVHETVTRTRDQTVAALNEQGYSIHFIIAPDGEITQHGDLTLRMVHAGAHNRRSIGIEIVNPYYDMPNEAPWNQYVHGVINAPWADGGRYNPALVPQCEALTQLLAWLTTPAESGLNIPRTWIGYSNGRLSMGRVAQAQNASPGIYAHTYFHHADGSFPILYAWLRLTAGDDDIEGAYKSALELAEGARGPIDVRTYMQQFYPNLRIQGRGPDRVRPSRSNSYGNVASQWHYGGGIAANLPDRPANAQSGSAFAAAQLDAVDHNSSLAQRALREQAIESELVSGNFPFFLRSWVTVETSATHNGETHRATYRVLPDFLSIGSDGDFLRIPMDAISAQRVADHFNCALPTPKIVGQLYNKARTSGRALTAIPFKNDHRGITTGYYRDHNAAIEAKVTELRESSRYRPGQLIAGHKKNVVVSSWLKNRAGKLAIYGFYKPNHSPWQEVPNKHPDTFADYSHGVRLVHKEVLVNGEAMGIYDVLAHPVYHKLLSDEGPLVMRELRYRNSRQ